MRFDSTVYYHFGEVYPWDKLTDEFREIAGILDQAGFTTVWLAEHHFSWDGWNRAMTNPILVGADLAAHTKRIRVGQCGVILPDWHPIRVAEDIAMLDNMTKGRVDFGIARGYDSRSALQFNVHADRLNASPELRLIRRDPGHHQARVDRRGLPPRGPVLHLPGTRLERAKSRDP